MANLIPRWCCAPARPLLSPSTSGARSLFFCFSTTATARLAAGRAAVAASLPPRPKPPPESEIEESFLKGSGPGGQKINKTCSAVQLRHVPTGIVVKSQATRSRAQNRTIARDLLARRLDGLANGDQSRAAVAGRIKQKKRSSADKKSRRKYRRLAGAGAHDVEGGLGRDRGQGQGQVADGGGEEDEGDVGDKGDKGGEGDGGHRGEQADKKDQADWTEK